MTEHKDYDGDMYDQCGAVVWPQFSITFLLMFLLIVRLFIAPLTPKPLTLEQLSKFEGLDRRTEIVMLLFGVAGFVNVVLFGLMEPGPTTPLIMSLNCVGNGAIIVITIVEGSTILATSVDQRVRNDTIVMMNKHKNNKGDHVIQHGASDSSFGSGGFATSAHDLV